MLFRQAHLIGADVRSLRNRSLAFRKRHVDRLRSHVRREARHALLTGIVHLRVAVARDRHGHFLRLINRQLARVYRNRIVSNRGTVPLDNDVLSLYGDPCIIGAGIGLAVRIVLAIDHIDLRGDGITGEQTGNGVFLSVRIRNGLGRSIVGMRLLVRRDRQRHLIVDDDDILAGIRLNLDRSLVGGKTAYGCLLILLVKCIALRSRNRLADGLRSRLIIGNLDLRTLQIVVDDVARLVKRIIQIDYVLAGSNRQRRLVLAVILVAGDRNDFVRTRNHGSERLVALGLCGRKGRIRTLLQIVHRIAQVVALRKIRRIRRSHIQTVYLRRYIGLISAHHFSIRIRPVHEAVTILRSCHGPLCDTRRRSKRFRRATYAAALRRIVIDLNIFLLTIIQINRIFAARLYRNRSRIRLYICITRDFDYYIACTNSILCIRPYRFRRTNLFIRDNVEIVDAVEQHLVEIYAAVQMEAILALHIGVSRRINALVQTIPVYIRHVRCKPLGGLKVVYRTQPRSHLAFEVGKYICARLILKRRQLHFKFANRLPVSKIFFHSGYGARNFHEHINGLPNRFPNNRHLESLGRFLPFPTTSILICMGNGRGTGCYGSDHRFTAILYLVLLYHLYRRDT